MPTRLCFLESQLRLHLIPAASGVGAQTREGRRFVSRGQQRPVHQPVYTKEKRTWDQQFVFRGTERLPALDG